MYCRMVRALARAHTAAFVCSVWTDKMMQRFPTEVGDGSEMIDEGPARDAADGLAVNDDSLPSDENERLVALCEAPALLWRYEPERARARAPEPFGMIA
jgi:hypothetical protein